MKTQVSLPWIYCTLLRYALTCMRAKCCFFLRQGCWPNPLRFSRNSACSFSFFSKEQRLAKTAFDLPCGNLTWPLKTSDAHYAFGNEESHCEINFKFTRFRETQESVRLWRGGSDETESNEACDAVVNLLRNCRVPHLFRWPSSLTNKSVTCQGGAHYLRERKYQGLNAKRERKYTFCSSVIPLLFNYRI